MKVLELTMSHLIEFPLQSDGTVSVLVESDEDIVASGDFSPISNHDVLGERAKTAFETAIAGIRPAAAAIINQLSQASPDLQEITVEFGVKLSGEVGAVIAKTSTEGHCVVTLKWARS